MKDKKMKLWIAGIIFFMIFLAVVKSNGPKPIEWEHSFYNTKTDPYGTYITYQLLGDIFNKKNIRTTRMPVYNNLKKDIDLYFYPDDSYGDYEEYKSIISEDNEETYIEYEDSTVSADNTNSTDRYQELDNIADTTSFIFINSTFSLEELDLEYMLDFVGMGNNVFISSETFDNKLLDTLKIKSRKSYLASDSIYTLKAFPDKKYSFGDVYGQAKLNTDSCKLPVNVLATNNVGDTIFIDVKYGKGHIFLHTIPTAFANVNMLQIPKYDFGFRCLSYLPENSKIIWDEYQKQGAIGEGSIFKMMLSNPPLRLALYLILGGFLIFMIFRAKRTQRIIPVIEPPVNSSLEFLGTISNLYYRKNDFRTILIKRHTYFLDFIRKHYYMPTECIDDEFVNVLSAKSGVSENKLKELFIIYKDLTTLAFIPNEAFLKYNSLLEEFYHSVQINK